MDRKTFSASIRAAAAKLSASDGTMDNVMEKLEDAHAALDDAATALTFSSQWTSSLFVRLAVCVTP